ncbi:extensin-like domain-containing protein [Pararhodobacter marinus]|uniref:extensin-like domain-containing protein n=1 Tax=Pararhodobacter marinus TaxID=2184063 RepID=UPI003517138F
MRRLRLCLLVAALGALLLAGGTQPLRAAAPDSALFPRARPGGLGGAVRMTIAEAAAQEAARAAAAARARAASDSAAQAARQAEALSAASDRAAAEAMAAVAGGAGGVVISEAAEAEMAAFRARQEAEAARIAAAREEARRIAAERAEARASAAALAASDTPVSPLAVARSLVPRPASPLVRERFAALALRRAPSPARSEAPSTTPTLARASGGGVRGNLCGTPGLEGRVLDRIRSRTQGCGVTEPVSVTNVQGIPLSLAATMDCDTARAFERWVRTEMIPTVGRTGGGIAQIRVIGHYSCRTRNSQRGARISEHGRGRAIDVAGYQLRDGETVSVLDDYRRGRHSRSLRRMYEAACGIFRTTLSPDSDRFHQDHFHFDLAQHRGGGTYCR